MTHPQIEVSLGCRNTLVLRAVLLLIHFSLGWFGWKSWLSMDGCKSAELLSITTIYMTRKVNASSMRWWQLRTTINMINMHQLGLGRFHYRSTTPQGDWLWIQYNQLNKKAFDPVSRKGDNQPKDNVPQDTFIFDIVSLDDTTKAWLLRRTAGSFGSRKFITLLILPTKLKFIRFMQRFTVSDQLYKYNTHLA